MVSVLLALGGSLSSSSLGVPGGHCTSYLWRNHNGLHPSSLWGEPGGSPSFSLLQWGQGGLHPPLLWGARGSLSSSFNGANQCGLCLPPLLWGWGCLCPHPLWGSSLSSCPMGEGQGRLQPHPLWGGQRVFVVPLFRGLGLFPPVYGDQGIPVLLTLGGTVGGLHPPYLCRGPGVVSILLSPGNCVFSLPVGNPTCVCPPRPREVSIPFPFRGPGGLHPPYLWGNRSGPCPPLLWEVRGSLHPPPLMRGGQGSPHPPPFWGNWGCL